MLKVLSKCIREYKQASLKAPLMVSLEVVMECIIPFIIAQLVNRMKAGAGFSEIAMYGLVLVVMATLSLIFGITAGNACATASCGFAKNVRKDLFYKIQDFSFENIDRFSSSSLVTRLTTDVTNVQMAYMMIVRIAIRAPLMLVFAFVMAFIMGGRMACIFIIVVPILGIGLFSIIRLVMPLFRAVFNKYDALNNSVQENIKGIRVVKSYVREEYEKEKFDVFWADLRIIKPTGNIIKHAKNSWFASSRYWNHPTTFIRAELYKANPYALISMYDDYDLFLRLRNQNAKIVTLNEVLADFNFGGMSTQKNWKETKNRIRLKCNNFKRNGYGWPYYIDSILIEVAKYLLS